jgi:uncharacterized protein (TIGR03435 family)
MAELAQFLSGVVGQPVVDRTGLPGLYDINLHFVPESLREQPPPPAPPPGADATGRGRGGRGAGIELEALDLRSALKEQLGLKLEKTKAPVPFLVITSAEKPSEN